MQLNILLAIALTSIVAVSAAGFSDEYVNMIMDLSGKGFDEIQPKEVADVITATNRGFNCDTSVRYPEATSVHALRPSDIKIMGAYGDSITAANGANAKTILGLLEECRGVSWSIGGEKDLNTVFTLPNIIKKFNPDVRGFSTGSGTHTSANANLNAAIPGSTTEDIMAQVVELVRRIKDLPGSQNQWKLITLFIGGNDLCKYCNNKKQYTAENYVRLIKESLDYLKANLSHVYVNLVQTMPVQNINLMNKWTCIPLQVVLCGCAMKAQNVQEVTGLVDKMLQQTAELVESGRYDTDNLFTVSLHSMFSKMTPPLTSTGDVDYTYFSQDCFHLSRRGHEQLAQELWNSMLTPVPQRQSTWMYVGKGLHCPSDKSKYFYTRKNSATTPNIDFGSIGIIG